MIEGWENQKAALTAWKIYKAHPTTRMDGQMVFPRAIQDPKAVQLECIMPLLPSTTVSLTISILGPIFVFITVDKDTDLC